MIFPKVPWDIGDWGFLYAGDKLHQKGKNSKSEVSGVTAEQYRGIITEACKKAGTYQVYFDEVILSLAEILQRRDEAKDVYLKSGSNPIIQYTNKGGKTNPTKNPALSLWMELQTTALHYWRELGLTPSGLRKLNEEALKPVKRSVLAEALRELG